MRHRNIWRFLVLLSVLLVPLACTGAGLAGAAHAEGMTLEPVHTAEIDLGDIIGNDAVYAESAWMLNPDVCVVYLSLPDEERVEIVLVDVNNAQVLSRTAVSDVSYPNKTGWEEGSFYIVFAPPYTEDASADAADTRVSVAQDGTVSVCSVPRNCITMPDGTVIRAENDGLYSIKYLTEEAEESALLLQGVPHPYASNFQDDAYEAFQQYEACPDEVGYDGTDEEGLSLSIAFPMDEDTFNDHAIWFSRTYNVYKALDDTRFLYTVSGWEWGAGFGIYDLATRTNHRITGRGYLYGMAGNKLYGSALVVDSDTYQSEPLPLAIQEQFKKVSALVDEVTVYDMAPDGKLIAFIESCPDEESALFTLMDAQTGGTTWQSEMPEGFPDNCRIRFYGNAQLMIFAKAEEEPAQLIFMEFEE